MKNDNKRGVELKVVGVVTFVVTILAVFVYALEGILLLPLMKEAISAVVNNESSGREKLAYTALVVEVKSWIALLVSYFLFGIYLLFSKNRWGRETTIAYRISLLLVFFLRI
ncbi:hypothetical protein [Chitinophaga tropicalis]|uniref:Uncharacterized protein n=1 Tax=Chitinophaga tropicalis TaxID=2683588 RepID=A0A7K1U475_9BACT|nr:hypothetical protein [Chitinophaga tropicalis]MVT09139.1 hypothetical protein [Chitinophaga tropicalis]